MIRSAARNYQFVSKHTRVPGNRCQMRVTGTAGRKEQKCPGCGKATPAVVVPVAGSQCHVGDGTAGTALDICLYKDKKKPNQK